MAYRTLGTVTTSAGGAYYNFVSPTNNLNQSFRPSITGTTHVNSVKWYGKTVGTVDIYLKTSGGTTLAATTDNEASVAWHTISFGYEAVTSSSTYYVVFVPRSGGSVYLYHDNTHDYSNGEGYQGSGTGVAGTDLNEDFGLQVYCYEYYTTPTVTTSAASSVGLTSATANGNVTDDGNDTVTSRGVYWGTAVDSQPNLVASGSGTGAFTAAITGLSPGVEYFFKAFATNAAGTSYGSVLSFTTSTSSPTVTTSAATSVSYTTATAPGEVVSDNGEAVTERGVCYNTTGSPTTSDTTVTDGTGEGTFSASLSSLTPNTTYYFRAYAINSVGTGYGIERTFTTLIGVPTVTTGSATNRTSTGVDVAGNVTSDSGSTITERGFVYATTSSPTTSNAKDTVSGTTGAMSETLAGLTPGTLYYFRGYATNAYGTGYGSDGSFTTLPGNPSNLAVTITGKTTTSLSWTKGTMGGYTIIRRKTGSYPTSETDGTLVYNGTSNTTTDSGLTQGTLYYYRAWSSTTADGLTAVSSGYTSDSDTTIADFINPGNALTDTADYTTVPAGDGVLYAQVSKNNGSTWSSTKSITFTASPTTSSFGNGISELWGLSWVGSDMDNGNFLVRFIGGTNQESNQTYKTFGFAITDTAILTGVQVQVKAAYDGSDILLYFVKVDAYYGTSPIEISQGSLAYDSTLDVPTYYDGAAWVPIAKASDTVPGITASAAELNITDGGNTTEKVLASTCKCKAYLNSAQNDIPSATNTKVLLDSESYDIGSDFDTANSRFVAPVTGYYQVNANVGFINVIANKRYYASIYVNGALYAQAINSIGTNTNNIKVHVGDLCYVTAGQYIELYTYHDDGVGTSDLQTGAPTTFLSIFLQSV